MKKCSACSKEYDSNVKFCGLCGAPLIDVPSPVTQVPVVPTPAPVIPTPVSPSAPKQKKKGKKILVFVFVVLGVLVLVGGALFVSRLIGTSNINYKIAPVVFTHNQTDYFYTGHYFVPITHDQDVEPIEVEGLKGYIYCSDQYVYDNNAIYCLPSTDTSDYIYKMTFAEENILEIEEWLSSDVINDLDEEAELFIFNMHNWQTDGKYIYFNYIAESGYFYDAKDNMYKIGRININDKTAEFIGDATGSSFTVHDGYIYYFDNGYSFNGGVEGEYDTDRIGIYKMKCDGTEKELLYDDFETDDIDDAEYKLCNRLQVCGDYLYFCYSNDGGVSFNEDNKYVYRIKLDGSDFEKVSDERADEFTFDKENEVLYYIKHGNDTDKHGNDTDEKYWLDYVYEIDLKSGDEKGLFRFSINVNHNIDYHDGHLYINDWDENPLSYRKDSPLVCGYDYDIENDDLYILNGYAEVNEGFDEELNCVVLQFDGEYFYWEKDKTNY